ncbi:hypothetical protein [Treponema pedis]|uniref:Uncharacterized protein n=1 Tax=Treponema pedis str. T A4 TaxID=1291379 RepID=S6A940_9SPIR|nr:hypothetical protein [Treponema pedis]AGT44909.1 hypothetical protein TPE_2435 [Treponema pedis str. T A4]
MKLKAGQSYRIKKDILTFKTGEVWLLANEGYQIYYGEHNFVFINAEKNSRFMVLRDSEDKDMEIYCHLDEYFDEINERHIDYVTRI